MKVLLVNLLTFFITISLGAQTLETQSKTNIDTTLVVFNKKSEYLEVRQQGWNVDTIKYGFVWRKYNTFKDTLISHIIVIDEEVNFVFSLDEVEKINHILSIYPLLDKIISKNENIDSLKISYINSINEKNLMLEQSIENKNKIIENKDSIIKLLKIKNKNYIEQIETNTKMLNKKIKEQKKKTWIISGSSIGIIILLLILL